MKEKKFEEEEREGSEQESHPAAFISGGFAGAIAGAAAGSMAGPIGTVAGAVIGGLVAAKASETILSFDEDSDNFWKENYTSRPYSKDGINYDSLSPAYKAGHSVASMNSFITFDEAEHDIRKNYDSSNPALPFDMVKDAAKDGYNRTIQLREERLKAEKERVETGEVSLRKTIVTENQTFTVPLEREEVIIERHPITDGKVSSGTIGTSETEEIARITTSEERVKLDKEVVAVEEVSLKKLIVTDSQEVTGQIQKEKLEVKKTGNVQTPKTDI